MGDIVGGVVGGLLERGAQRSAARRQEELGREAAELVEPFRQPGIDASGVIAGGLGLGDQAAADEAFQRFLGSTGTQAQLDLGREAIIGNRAAQGLLGSGATLEGLNTFGQDLAQRQFGNFLGQLGTVADRGFAAAGSQAGALTGQGNLAAQSRLRGSQGLAAGIGQASQGAFNALGGLADDNSTLGQLLIG